MSKGMPGNFEGCFAAVRVPVQLRVRRDSGWGWRFEAWDTGRVIEVGRGRGETEEDTKERAQSWAVQAGWWKDGERLVWLPFFD